MSFSTFGLDPKLLQAVEDLGFKTPTPIQTLAIPHLMKGRDVLATAVTGSGKTAAFLLPILHHLLGKPRGKTRVLVLAPTRELAAQIAEHLSALARHTAIRGASVYGGVSMVPQIKAFQKGVDVVTATPGRLLDHMQQGNLDLGSVEFLVLDEADRMLDMGFLPDVRRIVAEVPSQRQTLLFSATLPLPVVELARDMLRSPVPLNIEKKAAPAQGITHAVYPVPHELKSHLLLELLKRPEARSVLAFTRTKHRANRLADFLEKRGISCARIHGNRSQVQRTEALAGFKGGKYRVLVATDIAARGIDVQAIGLVVNFDVPGQPEDYIHRVGRTARADATGDAHTLVSPQEEEDLRRIEAHLGQRLPRRTVEGFDYEKKPEGRFEIPLPERIAAIRARKAEERSRAKANAERRAARQDARGDRETAPRPARRKRRKGGGKGERPSEGGGQWPQRHAERAKKDPFAKPRHPSGFTFVRTNRIPDSPVTRAAVDTSGVREDVHRSHKHEIGGLSHWGKAWRKQTEAQIRPPAQEE